MCGSAQRKGEAKGLLAFFNIYRRPDDEEGRLGGVSLFSSDYSHSPPSKSITDHSEAADHQRPGGGLRDRRDQPGLGVAERSIFAATLREKGTGQASRHARVNEGAIYQPRRPATVYSLRRVCRTRIINPAKAASANTPPPRNVAAGPNVDQSTPASTLAASSVRPVARLKTPNAVPRSLSGAVSATSAAMIPWVRPM